MRKKFTSSFPCLTKGFLVRPIQTFFQDHEKLSHPYILRLLGYSVIGGIQPSLLSPLYSNGNIMAYLKYHPEADRIELVTFHPSSQAYPYSHQHQLSGIFQAVDYLHKRGVAHKNIIPV